MGLTEFQRHFILVSRVVSLRPAPCVQRMMATIPDALATAVHFHQAGRLQEAESLYRKILARVPDHADALHLLGRIAHQSGRNEDAVGYLERAIEANPAEASFQNTLGEAYRALWRLNEAAACYQRSLATQAGLRRGAQ